MRRFGEIAWWQKVDWEFVMDRILVVALIVCLVYMGIFVYAPFPTRMFK